MILGFGASESGLAMFFVWGGSRVSFKTGRIASHIDHRVLNRSSSGGAGMGMGLFKIIFVVAFGVWFY